MLLDEYGVLVSGPLERWAQEFASAQASLGYVRPAIRSALFVFAFVSRWLGTRRLRPEELTAEQVESLRGARPSDNYARSLSKVLQFLRGVGVVPPVRSMTRRTSLDRLLDRYPSAPSARSSSTSVATRLKRCSMPPTAAPPWAAATTLSCCSRSRPGCASRS